MNLRVYLPYWSTWVASRYSPSTAEISPRPAALPDTPLLPTTSRPFLLISGLSLLKVEIALLMAPQSRNQTEAPSLRDFDIPRVAAEQPQHLPTVSGLNNSHASSSSADGDEEEEDDEDGEPVDDDDFESQYSLDLPSSGSSESESDDADNVVGQKPYLHRSNSSILMANAFAPPYYNRPPTPLPASPSLTSLLRPSFSATTSRPTTPDSSENDTPNDTEAAVAKSARIATTVPRANPKVPTYEYYGFVLYLLSSIAFRGSIQCANTQQCWRFPVMYSLWSYLPSPFLHQLGIYYYPNRWWSLAIPSFLVMTIVYIFVALASYNTGYLTLPMSSIENIVDEAAQVAVLDKAGRTRKKSLHSEAVMDSQGSKNLDWKSLWSEGTDAVMDVPVGGVCEILYGWKQAYAHYLKRYANLIGFTECDFVQSNRQTWVKVSCNGKNMLVVTNNTGLNSLSASISFCNEQHRSLLKTANRLSSLDIGLTQDLITDCHEIVYNHQRRPH